MKENWFVYLVAGILFLVYCWGEATGLLFLTMPIILPGGMWVIWKLNPDKPIN